MEFLVDLCTLLSLEQACQADVRPYIHATCVARYASFREHLAHKYDLTGFDLACAINDHSFNKGVFADVVHF